jgi:hypothetical protein
MPDMPRAFLNIKKQVHLFITCKCSAFSSSFHEKECITWESMHYSPVKCPVTYKGVQCALQKSTHWQREIRPNALWLLQAQSMWCAFLCWSLWLFEVVQRWSMAVLFSSRQQVEWGNRWKDRCEVPNGFGLFLVLHNMSVVGQVAWFS